MILYYTTFSGVLLGGEDRRAVASADRIISYYSTVYHINSILYHMISYHMILYYIIYIKYSILHYSISIIVYHIRFGHAARRGGRGPRSGSASGAFAGSRIIYYVILYDIPLYHIMLD